MCGAGRYYSAELALKIYAYPCSFWLSRYNQFDVFILLISYLQYVGGLGAGVTFLRVLRALRALRALRGVAFVRLSACYLPACPRARVCLPVRLSIYAGFAGSQRPLG
eukprot:SAG25_NODE_338_length_9538_cov_22.622630_6_plen_108_part_00